MTVSSGLFPLSRQQQFDSDGKLLDGARLFLFQGGTSTPISGYKDGSLTTPHTNPILLDSSGRFPLIYLAGGFYRQRLTTKNGQLVFDDDGIPVVTAGTTTSGSTVDQTRLFTTRDIKIRFDDQPLSGYCRLNGKTIGNSLSSPTGDVPTGSGADAIVQPLYEELWHFANIVVVGGKGANAALDFASNKLLVLPNCAGRGIFGMDDMGAGPQGVLGPSIPNSTLPGSFGGQAYITIAQVNIPNYGMSGSTTAQNNIPISVTGGASVGFPSTGFSATGGTDAGSTGTHTHDINFNTSTNGGSHSHTVNGNQVRYAGTINNLLAGGAISNFVAGPSQLTIDSTNIDHAHNVNGNTGSTGSGHSHTVSVSGTLGVQTLTGSSSGSGTFNLASTGVSVGSGGSGVAMNTIPPVMTFMIYIRY